MLDVDVEKRVIAFMPSTGGKVRPVPPGELVDDLPQRTEAFGDRGRPRLRLEPGAGQLRESRERVRRYLSGSDGLLHERYRGGTGRGFHRIACDDGLRSERGRRQARDQDLVDLPLE